MLRAGHGPIPRLREPVDARRPRPDHRTGGRGTGEMGQDELRRAPERAALDAAAHPRQPGADL